MLTYKRQSDGSYRVTGELPDHTRKVRIEIPERGISMERKRAEALALLSHYNLMKYGEYRVVPVDVTSPERLEQQRKAAARAREGRRRKRAAEKEEDQAAAQENATKLGVEI